MVEARSPKLMVESAGLSKKYESQYFKMHAGASRGAASDLHGMRGITLTVILLTWWLPALAQVDAEQVLAIGRNVLSMDDYMLSIQYFNQAIKAKPYLNYKAYAKWRRWSPVSHRSD
mgnify:CR=1 FL=1